MRDKSNSDGPRSELSQPRTRLDDERSGNGPWGKGFGDEFGDKVPRGRGSRMGRGPGIGMVTGDRRGSEQGEQIAGHGQLLFVLLELIGKQARYGHELIKAVEELTDGLYATDTGAVGPALAQLADEGLITEVEDATGGAEKLLALTEAGKTLLAGEAQKVTPILARLGSMGEE